MTRTMMDAHPAREASLISLLAGVWLFISTWIFGVYGSPGAWNGWIAAALIFVFGLIRMNRPAATQFSWLNSALGIWIAVSPWVYGYAGHPGWTVNSLIVGIIVFCAAIAGANSERESHNLMSGL